MVRDVDQRNRLVVLPVITDVEGIVAHQVMDLLCETICLLTTDMVKSITGRQWIIECF